MISRAIHPFAMRSNKPFDLSVGFAARRSTARR